MTILNESGVPEVLSPLHAVNRLVGRLPGAVLAVVGTRSEAYLARSLGAALGERSAGGERVVFAVLDPSDPPEGGRLAARLVAEVAGISGTKVVLLACGRSAELLGLDPEFEARLISRRLDLPVRTVALDPEPDSPACLSTDLEDRALAAMVGLCPTGTSDRLEVPSAPPKRGSLLGGLWGRGREGSRTGRRKGVVLLGSSGPADELVTDLSRAGVEVAGGLPGPGVATLPAIGEGTVVAVTDPYLVRAAKAAEERGAKVVRSLMPVGIDGTARFIQDAAAAAGGGANELGRARAAWEGMEHLRNRVRGKRVFFAGDTGFEMPLARFLADAGAVVLEVGAPRLDRRFLAQEVQALGADVDVVEAPDWRGQMKRADDARPDLVVTSPGLYVPLVARGHLCRSVQDFLAVGAHGYGGARRVLELLVRTFERAETLDAVDL